MAASHVWTGSADGRFSNPSNWIGGSPDGDPSASISFPASSRLALTNDLNGLTVKAIAFSAGGFTIGGNPMTLVSDAVIIDTSRGANEISCDLVLAGDLPITVIGGINDTKGLTLAGAISGSGGVALRGGGHLAFAGSRPNSYTGITRIFYGELELRKSANVIAIAGDVNIEDDGAAASSYLAIFNDEQIAKTSHLRVGKRGTFGCAATQTLGPLTLTRGAHLMTGTEWTGARSMPGTIILAADIDILGGSAGDIVSEGRFLLDGTRTVNAAAGNGAWTSAGLGQKSDGSGLILNGSADSNGSPSRTLAFGPSTWDGPTTIRGGWASTTAPKSDVDLQDGSYAGHCKSLTAEGGVITAGSIIADGDVKLSPGVIVALNVGSPMTVNGTLDIAGATLRIDFTNGYSYGAVSKVVDNKGTKPVSGAFAGLPEGSLVANRYRITYAGGDGNDITLTDFGLLPANVSLTVPNSFPYPQVGTPLDFTVSVRASIVPTGTVTFSAGQTVLAIVPLTDGVAKVTGVKSLPRGNSTIAASYSGDARVAPAVATASLMITALTPTLTSIYPTKITGGAKTTLSIYGTNFVEGTSVVLNTLATAATFVSPTELRLDYTPYPSDDEYKIDVAVQQPDPAGPISASHLTLSVTGVKRQPPPLTFGADKTATLTGVTPGAMTLWVASLSGSLGTYDFNSVVTDSDRDGTVALRFPYSSSLPLGGIWLVADLDARRVVADNPDHDRLPQSEWPFAPFLRDGNGNYTHVRFPAHTATKTAFAWARPGRGAWYAIMADNSVLDEDGGGGSNGYVAFETSSMQPATGSTNPPPADGIKPGDLFLAIDNRDNEWWGEEVTDHLSESVGPGKLALALSESLVHESRGVAKIIVERTEGTDGTATVQYATADDTAIAGRTYTAQAGTLTFERGEIFKFITVPLTDDRSYGGNTQFIVKLTNVSGARMGETTTTAVTIFDDDPLPVLSVVAPSSIQEGDGGTTNIPVVVKLTGATTLPVTVNWRWMGAGGQLRFAPGETQKTLNLSYEADTTPAFDQTFTLELQIPQNADVATPTTNITIVDDDFAGVSILDASVIENAGKVVVPLLLSRSSLKPITVKWEARAGSAIAGSDFAAASGTITVSPTSSSITIPIANDSVRETTEAFEVVLTSITGGKLERSTATVVIVDDDTSDTPPAPRRRTAGH